MQFRERESSVSFVRPDTGVCQIISDLPQLMSRASEIFSSIPHLSVTTSSLQRLQRAYLSADSCRSLP
jgi:hypothetical protein